MPTQKSHGLAHWFISKKRGRGPKAETFVTLKDSAPERLRNAVYAAHAGDGPNDWVYEECRAACEAIDSSDLTRDDVGTYADGRVEIYTRELYQWAADHCTGSMFSSAESRLEDLGFSDKNSVVQRLSSIQCCAIEAIAETMLEVSL